MIESDKEKIIKYLRKNLPKARFNHIIGTLKVAKILASRYKVSQESVQKAALLHDIARGLTKSELVSCVKKFRLKVPNKREIILYNPNILHSFVGAYIARKRFGIKNKNILRAISFHTIAARNMDKLSKIIYVADSISPDRRYPDVKKIRYQALRNLDNAFEMVLSNKIHYVLRKKSWLHPNAVSAWNSLGKNRYR